MRTGTSGIHRRLTALETQQGAQPCAVCKDYSRQAEILRGDEPEAPDRVCPACGRIARWIIRIPCPDDLEAVTWAD